MKEAMKSIVRVFIEMICSFFVTVKVELQRVSKLLSLFIPLIALYSAGTVEQFIVIYLLLMLLENYINRLGAELNGKDMSGLPVREKRYVLEEDGMYFVEPGLLDEALEYLGELEEYFSRTYINNKKHVDKKLKK